MLAELLIFLNTLILEIMNINLASFVPWLPLLATFAVLSGIWIEGRRQRVFHGLEFLLKLRADFDSEYRISKRKAIAKLLIKNDGLPKNAKQKDLASIYVILDHFQLVGELTRHHHLNMSFVNSEYGYWIIMYCHLFEKIIHSEQEKGDYWEDATWLQEQLRRRYWSVGQAKQEIREFLAYEANL